MKKDSIQDSLNKIDEIGKENARLIPQVEGWCTYLIVEGYMSGFIAEAKRLPNNVALKCQHAAYPVKWHNLALITEEFIQNNCLSCSFHKTRFDRNYGQTVVERLKKREEEKLERQRKEVELAEKVALEAIKLIDSGGKDANQTQLSILKLVAKLPEQTERHAVAIKLSAAAQLDPGFFSDAALDVLFMYFEDEHAGGECIEAAYAAMVGRRYFPKKAFELSKAQISTSPYFNVLAKILSFYIVGTNVGEHRISINQLIGRLWYKRSVGEPAVPVRDFEHCEALIINLCKSASVEMADILKHRLEIDQKEERININFLLRRILPEQPEFIIGLLPYIIKSLELTDDEYEQSADDLTIETLTDIVKVDPERVIEALKHERAKLSVGVQSMLLIDLNIELLRDPIFTQNQSSITAMLTDELVEAVLNHKWSNEIHKESLVSLAYFIDDCPELFESRFDGFLGYQSQIAEEDALFKFYKREIENKSQQECATFNYLVGKDTWEIMGIGQNIETRYREIKKILGALCEHAPSENLPKVFSLISKIESSKNEEYKKELISLVMMYGKDPAVVAGFIPQLYLHLLDPKSMVVRIVAMKFMDVLFDKFPMLVTSSLWDLFDVFINDQEPAVKGLSLSMLGTIARKYPERISSEYLKIHKGALFNDYVFVHKHAIQVTYDLYRSKDSAERLGIAYDLWRIADVYLKGKDEDILSSAVDQMLYLLDDQPEPIFRIAARFIEPRAMSGDYHIALQLIDKLHRLIRDSHKVVSLWLNAALHFLKTFPDNYGSQSDRVAIFFRMHRLERDTIISGKKWIFEMFTAPGTATQRHFDIAHGLDVLGYFECYELINEITAALKILYPNVEANRWVLRNINFWSHLAKSEMSSTKDEKITHLKAAKNVFQ